jgi:diguanylate cyclase (GGDEF)-like protein
MSRVNASILGALATFLGAIVLTALGLVWQTRQTALQDGETQVVRFTSGAATALNRSFLGVDVLLASMDELLGLSQRGRNNINPKTANQLMSDVVQQSLLVRYVALVDAQARVIASSKFADEQTALALPNGFIDAALGDISSALTISAPALSTSSAQGVLYLARHFRLADGSQVLAVAELQIAMLTTVMVEGLDVNGLEITLERATGQLIASVVPKDAGVARSGQPPSNGLSAVDSTHRATTPKVGPFPWDPAQSVASSVQRLPARVSGGPAIVAAQPILYQELLVTASVPLQHALRDWYAKRNLFTGIALVFGLMTLAMGALVLWYITRITQARRAIAQSKSSLDQALESMANGFVLLNATGEVVTWNQRYVSLFPWTKTLLATGLPFRTILEEAARQDMTQATDDERRAWVTQRLSQQSLQGSLERKLANGGIIHITERRTPDGGTVMVYEDVTALRAATTEIEQLAFYDPLTHLPNRRLLSDRLTRALTASARSGQHGAVLFLDLDHFKTLNDTLGHDMGDRLLERVAQRLTACVREQDTVARLGGDEFVVMLEGLGKTSAEALGHAKLVGDKILSSLNQPFRLGAHLHNSTPSIGATLFGDGQKDAADLLKQADIAMYQVKASGRNALFFFNVSMQSVITDRASLEADLRTGLVLDQFELHYQGQFGTSNQPVGAEALIRWHHPARGLVLPTEFIGMAEETALIVPLGHWVLTHACRQLKRWEAVPHRVDLVLAVNVSARQFRQADFVSQVKSVLRETAANPKRLKLELTESLVLANVQDTIEKMNALKKIGVRFAIDDFGTGQSSLTYLTQLPLDQLKIDQSFVRNIGLQEADAVIIDTIIGMAGNLSLEVLAEGVETREQRDFLQAHGCGLFQGYLFSRPVSLAEFELQLDAITIAPRIESTFDI